MLMNVEQIAKMFDVNKRTIYRWVDEVGLPCIKIENTLRFDENEIREWWKNRREKSNEQQGF